MGGRFPRHDRPRVDASRPAQDIERSPFAEKIFKIFDHDLSGELDFVEFVCAIWNFCTMDDADVVSFAFECFEDRNPVTKEWWLQQEGVDLLTQSILDHGGAGRKTCKVFFDDIIMRNGKVTERDWTKWTQHNRRALRPLIDLRNKMRRQIVGEEVVEEIDEVPQSSSSGCGSHDIEKARSRRPIGAFTPCVVSRLMEVAPRRPSIVNGAR